MYGWLWRVIPGPAVVRVAVLAVLAVMVVVVCFSWVFPAIAPYLPLNDITVE